MKMLKNTARLLVALILVASTVVTVSFALTGCKGPVAAKDQANQYTCAMHPEVVQDQPGSCPKCGMKLVEKR